VTPPIDLTGTRVLVTGAAGALGAEIAAVLAGGGATVVVSDLDSERTSETAERLGAQGVAAGDVTVEQDADAIVASAVKQLGGLDATVNAAGIAGDFARTVDQPLGEWQAVMDVNLRGTFLVSRAAAREMLRRRRGSIVNIGSIAGIAGFPSSNSYAVSKAAVAMLTRTLAGEWSRSGVRVNCVSPGVVDAGLFAGVLAASPVATPAAYLDRIPLGRLGAPHDVANAVAFLISDLAAYVTGVELPVDGGWTACNGPVFERRGGPVASETT
jgi:NAD(P)-dependent dehydrogenase (short-subunit alcohol dehydrogenase family)